MQRFIQYWLNVLLKIIMFPFCEKIEMTILNFTPYHIDME